MEMSKIPFGSRLALLDTFAGGKYRARMKYSSLLASACVVACAVTSTSAAQGNPADDHVAESISRWITLPAPAGAEEIAGRRLMAALPGFTRDAVGNLIKHVGSGSPRRVVACALDVSSYSVSEITDDGYIRLHRAGATPSFPLWDQALEAQRVRIYTARGGENGVLGVGAIFNGHFAQQHRGDTTVVGVDQLWIDVGASSRADAEKLGIALLDPVTADRPAWTYDGYAAGPAAGARAGCAAVATSAQGTVTSGETVFILSAQHVMNWYGLTGALAQLGHYDDLTLIGEARRGRGAPPTKSIVPPTLFTGSLVESISAADARDLLAKTATAAGVTFASPPAWVAPAEAAHPAVAARTDAYAAAEKQVTSLLDIAGVHPHEWRVSDAVRAALPAWARAKATTDSAGNIIVEAGPDKDPVVFVAHVDEVGYTVDQILPDGRVTLHVIGGSVSSAWEGEVAELYFDKSAGGAAPEPLRGVFVPRDTAHVKAPRNMTAWFGLDGAALAARGVRSGAMIIGYKHAERLGALRLTGRSSDDRTGSAALLMAVRSIDPATLPRKTYFMWDVGEEAGLLGAHAFAATHGTTIKRTYAIDTFVSADTPLELRTFAFAPLGDGPVLRGLDNSTVVSRAERERVVKAAKAAMIPLQFGATQGSTDGSAIGAFGSPNIGLGWPGRYSHTPGEVLDLRDLEALSKLVKTLAVTP
jgi:putative aminopeptidase FrvX